MEGRYPTGLLLAITNCTDPSKSDEFNRWYNHMHIPMLLRREYSTMPFASPIPIPTHRKVNTLPLTRRRWRMCPRPCRST